jgi:hypothetical protein
VCLVAVAIGDRLIEPYVSPTLSAGWQIWPTRPDAAPRRGQVHRAGKQL